MHVSGPPTREGRVDVAAWLEGLGLERYAQAFADNGVDAEVLPRLTAEDLREIGVVAVGHRRKLLDAIDALSAGRAIHAAGDPVLGPARPTPPPQGAERRQLTVLFADLVASTALSRRLDPEEMREVLRAYQNAVAGEVARFEGHVAKLMGDGVLAYFGWPRAHEDDAERAVRAGLSIVEAVPRLATPAGEPLAARVGIASGLVVVGDLVGEGAAREEAVVGETPNLAARLQEVAAPGTVVVADGTRRLLGDVFELRPLGPTRLKGFAHPLEVFQALRERPAGSRFEAHQAGRPRPMVGRDQELALVLERWRRAGAGEGQAVLLVGEAGIGKSRLVRAVLDAVEGEAHTALRYQCSPHHTGTALWPVVRQLGLTAGLEPADTEATKLDKLEALLRQGQETEEVGEAAPLVAALLGIDAGARYPALGLTPQQQRTRTLAALVGQLLGLARRRGPVLMVLEDAHWIDPTTLELIGQTLDRIADASVLMLLTTRPDNQPALGGHPHVTRLTLNRLGRGATEAIVARLAGGRGLPPEVLGEIAARTDGVPLFVEELTKAVLEAGAGAALIPASLHASLMARLDRVPGVKEVAQAAACVGREFAYPLLAAVAPVPEPELRAALDRLIAAELVFARGEPPEASYSFKHALVCDAAHESLLRSRRKEMHRAIAEAMRGGREAAPEVIAHHYREAGDPDRAVAHLLVAGRRAAERSADVEAVGHLRAALGMLQSLPHDEANRRRELELLLALSGPLIATRGYAAPETAEVFGRARRLCEALGDRHRLFPVLYGEWLHFHTGLAKGALPAAEQYLELARKDGGTIPRLTGHRLMSLALCCRGLFAEALREAEAGLALYDPVAHRGLCLELGQDPYVPLMSIGVGWSAWFLDAPGRSREASAAALRRAREVGHLNTLAYALHMAAVRAWFERDAGEVAGLAGELATSAEAQVMPLWLVWGRMLLGWARMHEGAGPEGLSRMRRTLREVEASGHVTFRPFHLSMLAEAASLVGEAGLALAMVEEALSLVGTIDERFWEPELHRQRGEILATSSTLSSPPRAAEEALETAIALARGWRAGSLELRAAISLARLRSGRGEPRRAHDLLAPVYARFAAEVETHDRQEAKRLLDTLA
jgi:class 3 adenylate cyclase/predicted ATPase